MNLFKSFKLQFLAAAAAALIFSGFGLSSAQAQDCPRGFLDKAYCDYDGDLVADLPRDESKWVNPAQPRVEEQVEQCQVAQALEGTCVDNAQVVEAQIELCDSRHVREDSR